MPKIIVVDDSDVLRGQLSALLGGAGHQVVEAVDGVEGLSRVTSHSDVKLVICDVNMPRMDGLTLCEKIKEGKIIPGVPIVMLTTESSPEMKARGKAAGVLGWILKPFNPMNLLAAVDKLTSGGYTRGASAQAAAAQNRAA